MQLSCMIPVRKDFPMSDEQEPTAVQDNVIFVPFRLQWEISIFQNAGGSPDLCARATGCEKWVVDVIVKRQKREELRRRFMSTSQDPA